MLLQNSLLHYADKQTYCAKGGVYRDVVFVAWPSLKLDELLVLNNDRLQIQLMLRGASCLLLRGQLLLDIPIDVLKYPQPFVNKLLRVFLLLEADHADGGVYVKIGELSVFLRCVDA